MTDYEAIYRDHAEEYDRMVRAEDCRGELASALRALDLNGKTAVEVGVGTGRVTEMLLRQGCSVLGFERSPQMLAIARRRLAQFEGPGCSLTEADARAVPVADGVADLAVAGWVLGHMTHWEKDRWRTEVLTAVAELRRVVRASGSVVILETLGTGVLAEGSKSDGAEGTVAQVARAAAPNAELAAYYALLEDELGFTRQTLRTDYRFDSPREAADSTRFFFGEAFAARVLEQNWAKIPEHTGLWMSRMPA